MLYNDIYISTKHRELLDKAKYMYKPSDEFGRSVKDVLNTVKRRLLGEVRKLVTYFHGNVSLLQGCTDFLLFKVKCTIHKSIN